MPAKPKTNQPETPTQQQGRDLFQTPDYATDLIEPYLNPKWAIWEACCGQGKIVKRLEHYGFEVMGTDISQRENFNAFTYTPLYEWDCMVTNPPFSLKAKIAARFIEIDKPFALLIPGDWSRWVIDAMETRGCQLLVPTRRINYITPNGKQGKESAAQFHSVWLTRYLNLNQRVVFAELSKEALNNI